MDSVTVRTTLTAADWQDYVQALSARAPRCPQPRIWRRRSIRNCWNGCGRWIAGRSRPR
jgi:hypothetical protein